MNSGHWTTSGWAERTSTMRSLLLASPQTARVSFPCQPGKTVGVVGYVDLRSDPSAIQRLSEIQGVGEIEFRRLVEALLTAGGALETCCVDVMPRAGCESKDKIDGVWIHTRTFVLGLVLCQPHFRSLTKTHQAILASSRVSGARLASVCMFERNAGEKGFWWQLHFEGRGPSPGEAGGAAEDLVRLATQELIEVSRDLQD